LDFEIIGRHVEVTPAIREHLDQQIEKAQRFFDRIHSLKAVLEEDGDGWKAEFVAHLIKGATVVAKADDKDIYAAIEAAGVKLDTQLRRYNEKLKEHRVKAEAESSEPEEDDIDIDVDDEEE
jgi:putative sigma-54 modulation protein